MKDDFIIYFDKKQIVIHTLLILIFFLTAIYAATIVISNMLNSQSDLKQILIYVHCIAIMICGTLYYLYHYIYLFVKVMFKREKEAVIISDKGIYRSKWYIFSKPIFIDWDSIDVCTSAYHYIPKAGRGDSHRPWLSFNNNSICLKLKKEFYDNLPIIDKIACHLTNKTSNGYDFRIRLFFTKYDAKEVLGKIKEYRPKKNSI